MENKERPVFIPPRKRISKKVNGVQNYVDHIVSIQVSTYICKYKYFNFYSI